jgi:hypothetical protein
MFLRLDRQSSYLERYPDFQTLATKRINPRALKLELQPGRCSPLGSTSLGAAVMRMLSHTNTDSDILDIREAVNEALHQDRVVSYRGHTMGGDEVLYGRAGLLWAVLNLRNHILDKDIENQAFGAVPKLVDAIMDAGKLGAEDYAEQHGESRALPLMWPWFDGYYGVGA